MSFIKLTPRSDVWLCLHFPQLALEVFEERESDRPCVVVERRLVHCSNRDNLEPGLAISTASSLYAELMIMERALEREAELLQSLAHLAYSFTPMVAFGADNSLLLEIGSCRRLYRGIRPLLTLLQNALTERGHVVFCGIAHTPKAAWLLARYPHPPALMDEELHRAVLEKQLATTAIDDLQVPSDTRKTLGHMGIVTCGELFNLPYAALGKRFGAPLVQYLQQVRGDCADPQIFIVPPPVFRQGLTFLDGVPQRQMLVFPMKRLLQRLCDYLRARQLHCHVLSWQLHDAHRPQAEIIVELSRHQNDLAAFLELSRIKLEQVTLRESVFSLSLHSDNFFESAPASTQLFPDARDTVAAGHALLDRLRARLGSAALQRIECRPSLWPERSWQAIDPAAPASFSAAVVKPGGPRPLWLLPQPQQLHSRDGAPIWKTPLALLRGPERIDNHWWSPDGQQAYASRDYFVAKTSDDRLCWIFREALTPLTETPEESHDTAASTQAIPIKDTPPKWFLHGWFT